MSAQMFILSQTIAAEKEKTEKLELMARLCNYGESSEEDVCRKLFIICTQRKMDFIFILPKQRQNKSRLLVQCLENQYGYSILLIYYCPHLYGSASGAQDQMLEDLRGKVKEMYRLCVGDVLLPPPPTKMLGTIELHLRQLMENMESIPQDFLNQVDKAKDQEELRRWEALILFLVLIPNVCSLSVGLLCTWKKPVSPTSTKVLFDPLVHTSSSRLCHATSPTS